ncbi:hypothetical protein ROV80_05075 [Stenotrophomonas pavanii]|uniref:glycine-rich domain-containing protein n=1 Tax=Stenotrophomonas pavanii TaxID=487698 RepID=UPI0028953125|nr:hypothetical protein [Stenotrophomonas pavanii]MDT3454616.1 hypothetical protein [Stenotrophomonas pavanii]
MPEVNFFDHFELPWAKNGAAEPITDSQWQAGWSFIGATPPSVEQFNKLQQMSDQKAAWLFLQLKILAESAGLVLASDEHDSLLRSIKAVATGRLLRTSVFTKVGSTQYVSIDGGPAVTQGASVFNPLAESGFVEVEVQGAGGGGGGVAATSSTTVTVSGSGGAGSYAVSRFDSNFSGITIVVGAAGAGGAAGQTSGSNGGTSSFGNLVSAPGGIAGQSATVAVPPVSRGGSTPAAPPSGQNLFSNVGASGSGSVTTSTATGISIAGASSKFGQGGINGAPANGPGAGGGGYAQTSNQPALPGGAGGAGIVVVREYA